jgi:hypothetical protein
MTGPMTAIERIPKQQVFKKAAIGLFGQPIRSVGFTFQVPFRYSIGWTQKSIHHPPAASEHCTYAGLTAGCEKHKAAEKRR